MFHVKPSKSFKKGDYMIIFDLAIIIVLIFNLAFMSWGYKYLVTLFHALENEDTTEERKQHEHRDSN